MGFWIFFDAFTVRPTKAPQFKRTLSNLLDTPHKPHSAEPKRLTRN